MSTAAPIGVRIEIRGTVQGVGFRPFVYRIAQQSGIGGWVRNHASGVTIEAFGAPEQVGSFVTALRTAPPPAAVIRDLSTAAIPVAPATRFEIVASTPDAERRVSIPADLPTCAACLSELFDPTNRRHRYPFINCTDCGPRFTIALDVPYDRPSTTMARFTLCPDCAREYHDPHDRRFHAQPNACPRCGPRLQLLDRDGTILLVDDPLLAAAAALGAGAVVAIKGLGGFHLACDATDAAAVARLRRRKRREHKPLAVMFEHLAAARDAAALSAADEALVVSTPHPIVLAARRADADGPRICREVAPDGPLLGVMLPYTPLHHLLLRAVARPLVMTSANLSEEPICRDNAEAVLRLGSIVDRLLVHDREIAIRCDDSVARVIAGTPTVLRRSRGFVPRAVPLAAAVEQPILAAGSDLKNSFCLAVGDTAYLGPHVGDLDNLAAYEAYEEAIERIERFVGVRAERVACDLHPHYRSTRYARQRAGDAAIGVQHHHAHLVSVLAEHGLAQQALGLAWDGTGYGTDGTAWGGELLRCDRSSFQRLATMRPLRLAGGERAIQEPWRQATAVLLDALGADAPWTRLALYRAVDDEQRALIVKLLAGQVNSPVAHGVGRLFDACAALVLARPCAHFEGELAAALELIADRSERGSYRFALDQCDGGLLLLDLRPMVHELVGELLDDAPPARLAAKFHNTLARAAASQLDAVATGERRVVLGGGCFQNSLLVERLIDALGPAWTVIRAASIPPGDGGLALGQVVIADAIARTKERARCV